jgi:hypothetical protein
MRVLQPVGERGSLMWLQRSVALRPDLLQPADLAKIKWLSPTIADNLAEYRDGAFLERIGQSRLSPALSEFWPKRGPQWDALGVAGASPVLVEAKAHLDELRSPSTAASAASRSKIERAFATVQHALGISDGPVWTARYYQYANRLAHLWWLRQNGVDAKLLLVGFVGDTTMRGPSAPQAWEQAYKMADAALGLSGPNELSPHVLHVYPDVSLLSEPLSQS